MVITLLLMIPVVIAITGFVVFKGVQLGLRWQIQVKHEQNPTMETVKIPNPVSKIVEVHQQKNYEKQMEESKSLFNEWVHGAEEGR